MEFVDTLQNNPYFLILFISLIGLLVGSFLNVVAARLPIILENSWKKECYEFLEISNLEPDSSKNNKYLNIGFLIFPRSYCPKCNHKISWIENIPVFSYIFLRGKCKNCKKHISIQYPLVELISAFLSGVIAYKFGFSWQLIAGLIFTWTLIVQSVIDINKTYIPDDITLPILWLGLIINQFEIMQTSSSAFWGAIFGYLSLYIIYWLFKLCTGKEGMGYGDFKLLAMLGAWLGWQFLPQIVLISSILGAIIGIIILSIKKQEKNVQLPFGQYLATAGFIALIFGDTINNLYVM